MLIICLDRWKEPKKGYLIVNSKLHLGEFYNFKRTVATRKK